MRMDEVKMMGLETRQGKNTHLLTSCLGEIGRDYLLRVGAREGSGKD